MYYGDEIGMEGTGDPDNRRDFPGGFPGDPRNAFTEQGRTRQEQDIFHYVQSLLRLRAEHPALRKGDFKSIFADETAYVYSRHGGGETVLIAVNNSDQTRVVPIPSFFSGALTPLSEDAPGAQVTSSGTQIELQARMAAIYAVH